MGTTVNLDACRIRVDTNFLNLQQKICRFKNTGIRVDGVRHVSRYLTLSPSLLKRS